MHACSECEYVLSSCLSTSLTGITVIDMYISFITAVSFARGGKWRLTVDGNGHGLGQDIAVRALESGDLAQLVELAVVVGDIARSRVDKLDVEVVGLGDGEEGGGASIALRRREGSVRRKWKTLRCDGDGACLPCRSRSFRTS